MPMDALASDSTGVRARLLSEGLFITTGTRLRERFPEYLQTAPAKDLARSVTRVGWHGHTYLMPDRTIGQDNDEAVLYQSSHEAAHCFWTNWRKWIRAKQQKRRGNYYGSPLRAFIRRVRESWAEIESYVRAAREVFIRRYVPAHATGEVKRAADRFSLIGAAGELATEYGLTGWREAEARHRQEMLP